jgi:hypothetical protein
MTFGELPLQAQGALVILGLLLVKPIAMVLIDAWDGFCAWGERRRNARD